MNLKKKAVAAMLLFVALPLALMSLLVSGAAQRIITEKTVALSEQSTEKLAQYLSHDLQVLSSQVRSFASDPAVISFLTEGRGSAMGSESTHRKIRGYIYQDRGGYSVSSPIMYMIITSDGAVYSSMSYSPYGETGQVLEKAQNSSWYGRLTSFVYQSQHIFLDENWLLPLNGEEQMYFAANITDGSANYGVLLLGINKSYFSKLLENFKPTENSFSLLSGSGTSVWSLKAPSAAGRGEPFPEKEGCIEIVQQVPGAGESSWELRSFIPQSDIARESRSIILLGAVLVAFAALCTFLLLAAINRIVVTPVAQLGVLMKRVQNGELDVQAEVRSHDEIGALSAGFNSMVCQLKSNIQKIQEEENSKRELELKMLQAQINPHFIRNTLNTIRWMAELKKAAGISRALSSFIRLTDYSFRSKEPTVTVREECEYLNEYIYLQKLRYQNKFEFTLEVEEKLLELPILKLLLQPILENSLVHGLAGKDGFGTVSVSFRERDGVMEISVCDDGAGLDPQTLAVLQAGGTPAKNGSLGLRNVQERIRLHYGKGYGMSIHSSPGKGTQITLHIPLGIAANTAQSNGKEDDR